MKCVGCGHAMERMDGTHRYEECGLKNVILVDVPMSRCPSCKETAVEIPGMEELHLLIGVLVAFHPTRLKAEEVRYLRKHLGYSQEELAAKMGVTRMTITRWESGKPIRLDQDKHLRRIYLKEKGDEMATLPEARRILDVLVDTLPLPPGKETLRIRPKDWIGREAVSA